MIYKNSSEIKYTMSFVLNKVRVWNSCYYDHSNNGSAVVINLNGDGICHKCKKGICYSHSEYIKINAGSFESCKNCFNEVMKKEYPIPTFKDQDTFSPSQNIKNASMCQYHFLPRFLGGHQTTAHSFFCNCDACKYAIKYPMFYRCQKCKKTTCAGHCREITIQDASFYSCLKCFEKVITENYSIPNVEV